MCCLCSQINAISIQCSIEWLYMLRWLRSFHFSFYIEYLMVKLECIYRVPDALANNFFIVALTRPLKFGSISWAGVGFPPLMPKLEEQIQCRKKVPIKNDLLRFNSRVNSSCQRFLAFLMQEREWRKALQLWQLLYTRDSFNWWLNSILKLHSHLLCIKISCYSFRSLKIGLNIHTQVDFMTIIRDYVPGKVFGLAEVDFV